MLDQFNARALSRLTIAELHGLLARYRNDAANAGSEASRQKAEAQIQEVRIALTLKL